MDWLKLTSNGILRGSLANSPDVIQLTWIKLLALMSESHFRNGRFEYAQGNPYSLNYIAMCCGVNRNVLDKCLRAYENDINPETGLPRIQWDNKTLVLTNWQKYQSNHKQVKPPLSVDSEKAITRKLAAKYPDTANFVANQELRNRKLNG